MFKSALFNSNAKYLIVLIIVAVAVAAILTSFPLFPRNLEVIEVSDGTYTARIENPGLIVIMTGDTKYDISISPIELCREFAFPVVHSMAMQNGKLAVAYGANSVCMDGDFGSPVVIYSLGSLGFDTIYSDMVSGSAFKVEWKSSDVLFFLVTIDGEFWEVDYNLITGELVLIVPETTPTG